MEANPPKGVTCWTVKRKSSRKPQLSRAVCRDLDRHCPALLVAYWTEASQMVHVQLGWVRGGLSQVRQGIQNHHSRTKRILLLPHIKTTRWAVTVQVACSTLPLKGQANRVPVYSPEAHMMTVGRDRIEIKGLWLLSTWVPLQNYLRALVQKCLRNHL